MSDLVSYTNQIIKDLLLQGRNLFNYLSMSFDSDNLKPFDKIGHPDFRSTVWSSGDRRWSINDHYKMIDAIKLSNSVHKDINSLFETAKNILLYSWFAYRIGPVAAQQAFATTELALRKYISKADDKPKRTFRPLLKSAHELGYIDIQKLNPDKSPEDIINYLSNERNRYAHGTLTLFPAHTITKTLEQCATIISDMYDYASKNKLKMTLEAWE